MGPFSHFSFVMNLFKVPLLKSFRESRDILYSFKLLYKLIDFDDLTDFFITRNISYDLRSPRMLEEKTYSRVNFHFAAIPRLLRVWNKRTKGWLKILYLSFHKRCLISSEEINI